MTHDGALLRSAVWIVLAITLGACAWLPWGNPSARAQTPGPAPVDIISAGLLASRSGRPELGLTLANASDKTLWVSVHFQTPGGLTDCIVAKEMEAQTQRLYTCAQSAIRAETVYPIKITVFANLDQTDLRGRLATDLRFEQADVQALGNASQP